MTYLPYFVDERPTDGVSVVFPLPRRWRFQLCVVPASWNSRSSFTVEVRAFFWDESEYDNE